MFRSAIHTGYKLIISSESDMNFFTHLTKTGGDEKIRVTIRLTESNQVTHRHTFENFKQKKIGPKIKFKH